MDLQPKALLLPHPDEDELVSDNGFIMAKFLPPSFTSFIQHMDQGVLEAMKKRYRASVLRDLLLSQDKCIVIYLFEELKMIEKTAIAWDQISPQTIRHSWWKLIPIEEGDSAGQEDLPSNAELADSFQTLGYEFQEGDIYTGLVRQ